MSDLFLAKKPAWESLTLSPPLFKEANDVIAAEIQKITGVRGSVMEMLTDSSSPEGYYLLKSFENSSQLFLKIISNEHALQQVQAEKIAVFLKGQEVPVNASLPDFPKYWNEQCLVFAYPYVPMRFAHTDLTDMAEVGQVLARLHSALITCPFKDEIEKSTEQRQSIFMKWHRKLASGKDILVPRAADLKKIVGKTPVSYSEVSDGSEQITHGDMNCGNVIFSTITSKPIVLDFEDTLHSWFPPIVDIAMAVERFVLVSTYDDKKAFQLAAALINEYERHTGRGIIKRVGILRDTLHILSTRALCLLAEIINVGRSVPLSEWDKFFYLYELADRKKDLLLKIEQTYL